MVRLPPQHINWGQLSRAKTKDLNLAENVDDTFHPGMIIEGNEQEDDKYLGEFKLEKKMSQKQKHISIAEYGKYSITTKPVWLTHSRYKEKIRPSYIFLKKHPHKKE